MTFDAAMIEVEVERACEALGIGDDDAAYVMAAHRAGDGKLLREMLARGCDYNGYVGCRLAIREGLRRLDGPG